MSKNGLYLSEENKGGYGNPNGLYLTEQSTSSNNGAVRIGGSLYSKNWDNSYKGMHVPNGHGSLFNAMDQDARIIAQCEANKLLWIAEANKQKALENGANLNAPIVPPPPVLNNPVPNNPPLTELEKALAEIKALKEANAAKDLKIANMVSREEIEQIVKANKEEMEKITKENAEKDRVIATKDKDLEYSNQIKDKQVKEIEKLLEDKLELREQVNEHKDLTQEWKEIAKEKKELSQKLVEDLVIKNKHISQLEDQLKQLHLPNLSEESYEVLENHNQEHNVLELLGEINTNH